MKKLITILFLFAFTANAQIKVNIPPDKLNHATAGSFIGWTSNALTWKFTERKVLAFGVGVGMSALAGHLKEKNDVHFGGNYDKADLKATIIGGVIGSSIVSLITLRCVPKRNLPLEYHYLLDDENTMQRIKK